MRFNKNTQQIVGEAGNWRVEQTEDAAKYMKIYNELTNHGQNPIFSAIETGVADAAKEAISKADLENTQKEVEKMALAGQDWSSSFAGVFGPTLTESQKAAGPLGIIGEVLGISSILTDLFGTSEAKKGASAIEVWSGYADATAILNSTGKYAPGNWSGSGYTSPSNNTGVGATSSGSVGGGITLSPGGRYSGTGGGPGTHPGGAKGGRYSSAAKGGWITEPIFGVGQSGQGYLMGEAGPEYITPADQIGGIVANISINIDKIAHDIDLEQIKPIVERALLEVHSRRGII